MKLSLSHNIQHNFVKSECQARVDILFSFGGWLLQLPTSGRSRKYGTILVILVMVFRTKTKTQPKWKTKTKSKLKLKLTLHDEIKTKTKINHKTRTTLLPDTFYAACRVTARWSPSFRRYQIILLGDRNNAVTWETRSFLHSDDQTRSPSRTSSWTIQLDVWKAVFTCVSYAEARNRYRLDVRPSVRLSVCLSVRHTLAPYQNGWIYCHAFFTTR